MDRRSPECEGPAGFITLSPLAPVPTAAENLPAPQPAAIKLPPVCSDYPILYCFDIGLGTHSVFLSSCEDNQEGCPNEQSRSKAESGERRYCASN
jgi:hypothetical protein